MRRHGARRALFRLADATGARVETLLDNRDPQVRAFAVDALSELPHRGVPRWLITVLRSDDAAEVVVQALELALDAAQRGFPR